jgi:SAM-dependent methyltransferase
LVPHFPKVLDPITNETFAIHKCVECGLGHTVPQPNNLSKYYNTRYYVNRHGVFSNYCTKRRLRFVAHTIDEGIGKRLLDIGCGDGSFLLAGRDAGWKVTGTEINPYMARSFGLDVREEIQQVSETQFDCITMWHSLEHMRDIKYTLSQVSKLLNPDGRLIIAVPDNGGFQAKIFRHKWFHLDVPRHLYHFDAGSLYFCLRSTGFTIQHQWHQELEYDLIGWSQSALSFFFPYPNIFFDRLVGKQNNPSILLNTSVFILGSILTALTLPAVSAGTLAGRGGTLVTVAYRSI